MLRNVNMSNVKNVCKNTRLTDGVSVNMHVSKHNVLCWIMIQLSGSVLLRKFSLLFSRYLSAVRLCPLIGLQVSVPVSVTFAARLQPSLADGNLGCCLPGPGSRDNPLGCLFSDQHADQTALQTRCPFVPELSDDCLAGRLEYQACSKYIFI